MFSKRLEWNQSTNRISERLDIVKREGRHFLDLTGANPTRAGFDWPDGLLDELSDSRALRYDPDPRGILSAREAVAEYHGTTAERVLLTASTSEAYAYLFKLLADPGDEILAPRPSYPLFEFLARLESVRIIQYPLFYDHGWSIDLAALEELITPRTRAIVVVNPNNPTGSYLKQSELTVLEQLCARHDLALISDEVFSDYRLADVSPLCVAQAASSEVVAFSLSGLSKICGLPQLKLGWVVANSPAALERLELIADTYLSVATPVQLAAPGLLAARHAIQRQIMARLRTNVARLSDSLVVEGGWTAVMRLPGLKTDEEWVIDLLEQKGVLVQPGFFYDFPRSSAHVVLSLLTPEAEFDEGASRLRKSVTDLLRH